MKLLFTSVLLFCFSSSKALFVFDQNCRTAHRLVIELRLREASLILDKEKAEHRENALVLLLENYIDFFQLLSSDNAADYQRFKERLPDRLSELEKADDHSSWYYYSLGEVNLQAALIRVRFGEYWGAAWAMRRAISWLEASEKKYSGFLPTTKCRAVIQVMLGRVPSGLKFAAGSLGFKGSTAAGLVLLRKVEEQMTVSRHIMALETSLYSAYLRGMVDESTSYDELIGEIRDSVYSPVILFVKATIAVRKAHSDDAVVLLSERHGTGFPQLDYLMGVAKLNRGDADAAFWLEKFVKETRGVNFIKDAYLRIAWHYRLVNNVNEYQKNINNVFTNGNSLSEKDKQADNDAKKPVNFPELLSARLLFDGGYYARAEAALRGKSAADYKEVYDRLEFLYRSGRIEEVLGHEQASISNFKAAITLGERARWYYAANSSLHLGQIYEQKKDITRASYYYNACLSMKETEYKSSIDAKAREALERLKSK